MREKRVNLLVLSCSVIVATCASLSYCFVTADNPHFDKYVTVISRAIPLFLSSHISTASAATVWIPKGDEADEPEGSVKDEFAEVAHVFARPEAKVVRPKDEDEITQQPVPWTSLKNEWKIYQKIQASERIKKPSKVIGKKKGNEQIVHQDDDEGSSEEEEDDGEDGEEDEEDEEEEDAEGRAGMEPGPPPPPMPHENPAANVGSEERHGPPSAPNPSQASGPQEAQSKKDSLPLAFYGQQNHDDDERDYLKDEKQVFTKKKKGKKGKEEEAEDDDGSSSRSNEDYDVLADYELDDDDDAEDSSEGEKGAQKQPNSSFDDIPLAIREMILNDLANQNNGSGYTPNLTPKVTGGSSGSSASVENENKSGEENSSEEEDDNNAAEVIRISGSDPTPPAITKPTEPTKGDADDDEEEDDDDDINDEGGKGKGKGKKGKKNKKNGGWGKPKGWGWKPPIHHPPPKGWGWDPAKHDGLLEQLVKGSTWERVLKYYHWKRDQAVDEEGGHGHHHDHGHDDHHHGDEHGEHPGHELGLHSGWHHEDGHYQQKGHGAIKKLVKGAFQGSFWERAVHTYAKYKENQAKNPKKPTIVDLSSDQLSFRRSLV